MARVDRSFALGPDGAPQAQAVAHGPGEQFFASGEAFSGLHLCNHWAAETLNAAGLAVTPVLDTVPAGLVLDLKLRAGM
jgi:broad specificity phosphatase PhoE